MLREVGWVEREIWGECEGNWDYKKRDKWFKRGDW